MLCNHLQEVSRSVAAFLPKLPTAASQNLRYGSTGIRSHLRQLAQQNVRSPPIFGILLIASTNYTANTRAQGNPASLLRAVLAHKCSQIHSWIMSDNIHQLEQGFIPSRNSVRSLHNGPVDFRHMIKAAVVQNIWGRIESDRCTQGPNRDFGGRRIGSCNAID